MGLLGKAASLPSIGCSVAPYGRECRSKCHFRCEPKRAAELAALGGGARVEALKVKVGIEPEGDIAGVKAVRGPVGPDFRLGM